MGFRFRKSIGKGPLRVNFSKSGIGYSVGGKGFRYTKKAGGGTRTTTSIPGTGISYVKDYGTNKKETSIRNESLNSAARSEPLEMGTTQERDTPKKNKLISLLTNIFVFLLVAGFSFLALIMVVGSLLSTIPDGFLSTVLVLAVFIVPIILGYWVVRKIHLSEQQSVANQEEDIDADINDLIDKEESTSTVIKEELSCWNWQLIAGSLVSCIACLNLFSHFFLAIILIVLALGLLSVGGTKYKEKKELQERALKRKIMAAVAKPEPPNVDAAPALLESPAPVAKETPAASTSTEKTKKYRVAGVSHYEDNILSLAVENSDYDMTKRQFIEEGLTEERVWKYEFYPDAVELVPEPDNAYDPNAVKVIVDGEHVGYIKSGSCAHIKKILKDDRILRIDCEMGGGPYKYVSEDYDDDKDKEVYTLEKDATNFFVHLQITERS